jgi:NADPH:quinone reductase-like Zn-dependent oxidoreductase
MATTSSSSGTLPAAPAVVREKPSGETMRAIILKGFGGLDSLVYTDIPKPLPKDGEVVIKVEGFGINHAEMHMRRGNGPKPPKSGWLGGLDPIGDFNPLLRMASGVNLNFFGSFVFGTPGFPLSDVPLQDIARQVAEGKLEAKPSRVFSFDQIHEAHRVMEAGDAGGKMVVVMD